jgi:hypothetical protein
MKQTAVEWLVEQYKKVGGIPISMADQAKEMEKEQIVNAYNDCEWTGDHEDGEQYYNETFKQQEQ